MATKFNNNHSILHITLFVCLILLPFLGVCQSDSSTLKKVTITAGLRKNTFTNISPLQQIDGIALRQLNTYSVADAAKYFAGVLVKDYGGLGGLKTVSVRSLGATHTGVLYDGIPVNGLQTGQTDLGKYSTTFLQDIDLSQAYFQQSLMPAKAYASSAVVSINTQMRQPYFPVQKKWSAGLKMGSFGQWQPYAGIALPVGKKTLVSVNAEYTTAKGNYPFFVANGPFSEKRKRENSDIAVLQGEVNIVTQLVDSSVWQTKLWAYSSDRGLPGAIIFFNDRSVQRLWDNEFFVQSSLRKKLDKTLTSSFLVKYNYQHTRYKDPDFLNNAGGLDNKYKEQELYASVALNKTLGNYVVATASTDAEYAFLTANLADFAMPKRFSSWTVLGIEFRRGGWQANASGLMTLINDKVEKGYATMSKTKFTPTLAINFKPTDNSPFLLRAFYKNIFRMPTFNDLYYTQIGNRSLQPEYASQYNLGVTYTKKMSQVIKQFNISVDGYYNYVKDKIVAVPNRNLFVWSMLNVGKVTITGVDIASELKGQLQDKFSWQARVAYTFQKVIDITDRTASNYKEQLPYIPVHSGAGYLQWQYKNWGMGYSTLASGSRYTLGGNNAANGVSGWLVHDVNVSRSIELKNCTLNIKAELNNLSDERYDVVRYFPMQGRSYKLTLSIFNL
jgi:vitamin B12 transporter